MQHPDDDPFFITEEIEAEMIAAGYDFSLPTFICRGSPRKMPENSNNVNPKPYLSKRTPPDSKL